MRSGLLLATPGGDPSSYATLLAADTLSLIGSALPEPGLREMKATVATISPSATLEEIDSIGVPALLPLVFAGEDVDGSTGLVDAWAETVGSAPQDGMTLSLHVWLARAAERLGMQRSRSDVDVLRAFDGGWATSPGGRFDAKATYFAVALGSELTDQDVSRLNRGKGVRGWFHVGEPDVRTSYQASTIADLCGHQANDSDELVSEALESFAVNEPQLQELFHVCELDRRNDRHHIPALRATLQVTLRELTPANVAEASQLQTVAAACGVAIEPRTLSGPAAESSIGALQAAVLGARAGRDDLMRLARGVMKGLQSADGWSHTLGTETDPISTQIAVAVTGATAPYREQETDLTAMLVSLARPRDTAAVLDLVFVSNESPDEPEAHPR